MTIADPRESERVKDGKMRRRRRKSASRVQLAIFTHRSLLVPDLVFLSLSLSLPLCEVENFLFPVSQVACSFFFFFPLSSLYFARSIRRMREERREEERESSKLPLTLNRLRWFVLSLFSSWRVSFSSLCAAIDRQACLGKQERAAASRAIECELVECTLAS